MSNQARRGVVLLTVLWTVALLTTLAMAASLTFRGFASIMVIDQERAKADALLTAGLEVAAALVSSAGERPLVDVDYTLTLSTGTVHVRLDDEGGRIDLGKAPPELLAVALRAVGAEDADALARAIVAFRTPEGGAPKPVAGANRPGAAAASPGSIFTDVAELAQVPGMRAQWLPALAPLVTVFGSETVNPVTAPAAVLAVLPGVDPARLAAFLAARATAVDPKQLAASLGAAQRFLAVKPPQAVAVRLAVVAAGGYAENALAVIVCLPKDRQPYRVLSWNPMARS